MCGVVGLVSKNEVSPSLYEALTVIQHRGQDAAGISTLEEGRLHTRKQIGLVRDVFREKHIDELKGQIGIGHVRYPTAGGASREYSQPLYVNSPYGISISHNGNLVNTEELAKELYKVNYRHLNTSSDSEVILNVFAHELQKAGSFNPSPDQIFTAVEKTHLRLKGAYSVLFMISGVGLVAIRDPKGIRPLILGKKDNDLIGSDYMIASESPALSALEYEIKLFAIPPFLRSRVMDNIICFFVYRSNKPLLDIAHIGTEKVYYQYDLDHFHYLLCYFYFPNTNDQKISQKQKQ